MTPKTDQEIDSMRVGGKMLATILGLMARNSKAGITPIELSQLAARELAALGGKPAFRGFHGYPDIICISVNDQVQHSIPNSRALEDGDVVNFDFGVLYRGMITDSGISVGVGGNLSADANRLLKGTEEALYSGLSAIRSGCRVGDISAAIEKVLKSYHLGIVRDLVGHGVGHSLHEEPNIPNYGPAGKGPELTTGMTVAIEPITTLGKEDIAVDEDGWTLWTVDGSWSAQFEHSVLVTDTGCEILTQA